MRRTSRTDLLFPRPTSRPWGQPLKLRCRLPLTAQVAARWGCLICLLLLAGISGGLGASSAVAAAASQTISLPEQEVRSPENRPERDRTAFFPLEEIRPGMRAMGYTVFVGREPKAFDLEILGVLKGFPHPRQSAVLSRLVGEEIERVGVFQGMSGSPVYIEGRLVGAVAFGYQFAKDPIAGITPIEHMIEAFEQTPVPSSGSGTSLRSSTQREEGRSFGYSDFLFTGATDVERAFLAQLTSGAEAEPVVAGSSPSLQPIATPLALTGISPETIARFAPLFRRWGFAPLAGVAAATPTTELKKADASTLKPGSTVVVPLIRGDYSVSAAGTVTWRDGDRIYAFGHPFLSLGVSDFPMHEGEVVTVLSSAASSFKLSYPTSMVGVVRGDRAPGIYGELGSAPRTIPVEIDLRTSRGTLHPYRFDLVADRFLTPILLQMTLIATIGSTERTIGDSTLLLDGSIELKGLPSIRLENRISVGLNAPIAAAIAAAQPVSTLLSTGFEDLSIEKIRYQIVSRDVRESGQIDRLRVTRTEVRRGETLELQVIARTEGGREHIEPMRVTIPSDAPLGPLQLTVGDGAALQAAAPRSGFTPRTAEQLVREINRLRKPGRLYVRLSQAGAAGVVLRDAELPALPPSFLATLGSARGVGGYTMMASRTILEAELPPPPLVLSGLRTLTLEVVP
ncbi:MAG: SpoIVB peptidase S55 domain-containing protein [Blastocatellia bacterium]